MIVTRRERTFGTNTMTGGKLSMIPTRKISVKPQAESEEPVAIRRRDLVRGYATVLFWATKADIEEIEFKPGFDPCFSFVHADGTKSTECENVADPPRPLRSPILKSILWTMSPNRLWYWFQVFLLKFSISQQKVLLEVLAENQSSLWELNLLPGNLVAKRLLGDHDDRIKI